MGLCEKLDLIVDWTMDWTGLDRTGLSVIEMVLIKQFHTYGTYHQSCDRSSPGLLKNGFLGVFPWVPGGQVEGHVHIYRASTMQLQPQSQVIEEYSFCFLALKAGVWFLLQKKRKKKDASSRKNHGNQSSIKTWQGFLPNKCCELHKSKRNSGYKSFVLKASSTLTRIQP